MNKKQRTKFTNLLKRREIFVPFINSVCFFYSCIFERHQIQKPSHDVLGKNSRFKSTFTE